MNDITKIKVDGNPESSYQLYPRNNEFAKRAGGTGGSGVQSDWNQNDDTQPDYVKNRPFYMGDHVETVLVEESTVSFADDGSGIYFAPFPSAFEAIVGETYKVYWDGAAYECACVNFINKPVIGNLSIMGAAPDTGEPFAMNVNNGEGIGIVTTDTSASHTFSISGFVPGVVKIDQKYLPKTAFITYDSNTDTYSSDLTYDELYEIMLDGRQVVFRASSSNEYQYLTKWKKQASGRIDLALAGGNYGVSLYTDGTIGKTPIS